jgi:Tfp pilus assembly protein PilO
VSVRSLPPRAQLALVVAALLAVALLGYLVLISPKRSAAGELQAEIKATEAQLSARPADQPVEPAPRIDAADVFRATRAVPDEPGIPEVILELTKLARESRVSFESIAPGPPVERQGYRAVPITVVADGRYFNVSSLLARIRGLVGSHGGELTARGRLLTVDSVSLVEGQQGFPQTRATLHINALFGARSAVGEPTSTTGATPPSSGEPAAESASRTPEGS